MQKFKFISTLRYLSVTDKIDGSFQLLPGIDLVNDKKRISEILDDEFRMIAGFIESHHFDDANHIVFCEFDERIFGHKCGSNQALTTWIAWLDMLISDAWLVKDHAIVCEIAYMKMEDGKHSEWSNNNIQKSSSLSSGAKQQDVTFNLNELETWESKSHQLQAYLYEKNSTLFDSFVDKKFSRIARSLYFISSARKELHPAIKISHYCSAFESLFSTDSVELSHKLSERIAIFLKAFEFDPLIVFDEIKSFYTIRSKVTHGDSISDKKSKHMSVLSEKCDNYLRYIINAIIDDKNLKGIFDGNKEEFESYFKKILLTGCNL